MSNSENKPSGNTLLKTTLITLVAAVIVTVLFVMPAEFGIDPTGVGAQLGLLDLSAINASQEQSDESDSASNIIEGTYPEIPDEFDLYEPDGLFSELLHDGSKQEWKRDKRHTEREQ